MITHNGSFIWDPEKEAGNIRKHGIDFAAASKAFKDAKEKSTPTPGTALKRNVFSA